MTRWGDSASRMSGPDQPVSSRAASEVDRRAFLAACLRYPVVAVLITVGAVLVNRQQRAAREGQCPPVRLCDQCPRLGGCELPSAQAHRRRSKVDPS